MKEIPGIHTKTITRKGIITESPSIKLQCPRPGCKKVIHFVKGCGYSNPFSHLIACYGSYDNVITLFDEAKKAQAMNNVESSISSYFQASLATDIMKDLFSWIRFIVTTNSPVAICENEEYREFSKCNHNFGHERVNDVILELTKIVEQKIAKEIKSTQCGAIMHDGWTLSGNHYIGLYATYMTKVRRIEDGKEVTKVVPNTTLVSCSPMYAGLSEDDYSNEDDDSQEMYEVTSNFTAETHAKHFETVFKDYYGIQVRDWAKASIADNCKVNLKVAKLLGIPHVGCCNHKLNLDMNDWIDSNTRMRESMDHIADVMKKAKTKLKHTAMLRNMTHLKPVLYNKTRWSGKYYMFERWIQLRDTLIDLSANDGAELEVNESLSFFNATKKFTKCLKQFDIVTKKLQEKNLTLSTGRILLDTLVKKANERKNEIGSAFHGNSFKANRILIDGPLSDYQYFESGVIKIQQNRSMQMNDLERDACIGLLENDNSNVEEETNDDSDVIDLDEGDDVMKAVKDIKEKMETSNQSGYVNCDFIMCSAAEVERLWSIAKHILTEERRGMLSPLIFESLIFLKMNLDYWGLEDVVKAETARCNKDKSSDDVNDENAWNDDDM